MESSGVGCFMCTGVKGCLCHREILPRGLDIKLGFIDFLSALGGSLRGSYRVPGFISMVWTLGRSAVLAGLEVGLHRLCFGSARFTGLVAGHVFGMLLMTGPCSTFVLRSSNHVSRGVFGRCVGLDLHCPPHFARISATRRA